MNGTIMMIWTNIKNYFLGKNKMSEKEKVKTIKERKKLPRVKYRITNPDAINKNNFTNKEETVLRMRLGISPYVRSHTLDEISYAIGESGERARTYERSALRKLRSSRALQESAGFSESGDFRQ
jgi:DNA-directed RNA polymerase sigma subunit (sigma70/sigma32)